MILTDKQIRKLCQNETPLIENYSEESIQSESYDLSIGSKIALVGSKMLEVDIKDNISYRKMHNVLKIAETGYVLKPYEYILVSTKEKLNMPDIITAHVEPRTRYTRIGLLVSPQHINSSFSGNVWIGLFNASSYPITIYQDTKIAQFVFEQLLGTPTPEKLYKNKKGVFQNEHGNCLQGSVTSVKGNALITEAINRVLKRSK